MKIDSVTTLVETLRDHQILEATQLDALNRDALTALDEPETLVEELVRRGWLTAFQTALILRGRGDDLTLGPYLLLELLGEGGMGRVFKARHRRLRRVVALKVIRRDRLADPEVVRRFYREVHAAAQLADPNVVTVFDADEDDGIHYYVMEYVDGTDLGRLVKDRGPLPVAEACDYVRQAALGLQHAHGRGMVHRDIKPANLRVTADGRVKVLDMGLARLDGTDETVEPLTRDGALMGTPDFMAPEQADDPHAADIRADIYSLGCTLHYLLSGAPPFPGRSTFEKLRLHREAEPASIETIRADVPARLVPILRALLAKRPEDRPRTPGAVAEALAPFCRDDYADAEAASPSTIGWSPAGNGVAAGLVPAPSPSTTVPDPAPSTTGMAWADPESDRSGSGRPRSRIVLEVQRSPASGCLFRLAISLTLLLVAGSAAWLTLRTERFDFGPGARVGSGPPDQAAPIAKAESPPVLSQAPEVPAAPGPESLPEQSFPLPMIGLAPEVAAKSPAEAAAARAMRNSALARLARVQARLKTRVEANVAQQMVRPSPGMASLGGPIRPLAGDEAVLALKDLDEAIRLDPDLGDAYAIRGRLRAQRREFEPALSDLTLAIEHGADSAAVRLARGTARLHRKDDQGALTDFDEALRLDPRAPDAWIGRGRARLALEQLPEAEADIDHALAIEPDSAIARVSRAAVRIERRELDGALADLDAAIPKLDAPDEARERKTALFFRGSAYLLQKQYDRAIRDWEEIVKSVPEPGASVYDHLGRAYLARGDHARAVDRFREAIRLAPDRADLHENLSRALKELGRAAEAQAELEAAQRLRGAAGDRPPDG